eukprot:COSAG02_NODE_469_length_21727_cov_64.506334_13_plen_104_part_00
MLSCPFFQCSRTSATTHFPSAWRGRWVRGISPRNQLTTLAQRWCLKFARVVSGGLLPGHRLHPPRTTTSSSTAADYTRTHAHTRYGGACEKGKRGKKGGGMDG